jgi:hypothetical protein
MRSSRTRCVSFIFSVLLIAMTASAQAQTITTFDVTGAGTLAGEGTKPGALNTSGVSAGYYIDTGGVFHGFVRSAGGTITTFDAPGTGSDIEGGVLNEGGMNDSGTLTGPYTDASGVYHGLVRTAGGTITSFDVTGAGIGGGQGTIPHWIDTAGDIAGRYADSLGVFHAFVRTAGGTITTFDVPGAGTGKQEGTYATSISDSGVIAGFYLDAGSSFTPTCGRPLAPSPPSMPWGRAWARVKERRLASSIPRATFWDSTWTQLLRRTASCAWPTAQ